MNDEAAEVIEGREVSDNMTVEGGMVALISNAEINQQIATAHRFPRSLKRFRDEALQMVTLTEDIAKECIYALPRDKKIIEGPSARFAEVVASAWGNCRAGARIVNEGADFITAQGVFHDLERNVCITYEVQRRITNSEGRRYKADMIGVTGNAASSIALRNAILKGIPKAFWASMYQAARTTAKGDFKTLANRRADALKEFLGYGVSKEMIFTLLQVAGVEDITLDNLVTLAGLLTAIKEGDTTVEQAFGTDKPTSQMPKSKSATTTPNPADTGGQTQPTPPAAGEGASTPTTAGAAERQPQEGAIETKGDQAAIASNGTVALIRAKLKGAPIDEAELLNVIGCAGKKLEEITPGKAKLALDHIGNL